MKTQHGLASEDRDEEVCPGLDVFPDLKVVVCLDHEDEVWNADIQDVVGHNPADPCRPGLEGPSLLSGGNSGG